MRKVAGFTAVDGLELEEDEDNFGDGAFESDEEGAPLTGLDTDSSNVLVT